MIALFPVFGLIGVAVALVVALGGQVLPYSSLFSIVFGYGTLASLTIAFEGDRALVLGLGGIAGLVLAHALLGHRRRNSAVGEEEWGEMAEPDNAAERSNS